MKRAKRACVGRTTPTPSSGGGGGASGQGSSSSAGAGRKSHHLSESTTSSARIFLPNHPTTAAENNSNNVYWLKWNTKSDHFSAELSKLFGCGEGLMGLTDVTLVSADGHFIQAHKLVLSMCSPFFRRVFLQASKADNKSNNAIVVLANIKLQHLRYLLQFFYEGEIDVPSGELNEFLKIGEMLKIEGLSGYIKTFVSGNTEGGTGGGSGRKYTGPPSPSHLYQEEGVHTVHEELEEGEDMSVSLLNSYSLNVDDDDDYTGGGDGPNSPVPSDDDVSIDDGEDQCSNFSDEEKVGRGGRRKKIEKSKASSSSSKTNTASVPRQIGIKRNLNEEESEWVEIEPLSEQELLTHWRKWRQRNNTDRVVHTYYCAYSTRAANPACPARLNREVMKESGAVTFLSNQAEHCNHRDRIYGLTPAQKDFIIKMMMEDGVTAEKEVVKAMEEANVQIPLKNQIPDFIKKYRKKMGLGPIGRRIPRRPPPAKSKSNKKVKTEKTSEEPGGTLGTSSDISKKGISTNLPNIGSTSTAPGGSGYPGTGMQTVPPVPPPPPTITYPHLHQIQEGPRPVYPDVRGNPPGTTMDFGHFGLFNL